MKFKSGVLQRGDQYERPRGQERLTWRLRGNTGTPYLAGSEPMGRDACLFITCIPPLCGCGKVPGGCRKWLGSCGKLPGPSAGGCRSLPGGKVVVEKEESGDSLPGGCGYLPGGCESRLPRCAGSGMSNAMGEFPVPTLDQNG
jgi:hypothetical protein